MSPRDVKELRAQAAHRDQVRVQRVDEAGRAPPEGPCGGLDRPGGLRLAGPRRGQHPPDVADLVRGRGMVLRAGQRVPVEAGVPAAHRPAPAPPPGIPERHVAEFPGRAGGPGHHPVPVHDGPAHAGVEMQVHHPARARSGAVPRFGDRGEGGVVPGDQRDVLVVTGPQRGQVDIMPAQVGGVHQAAAHHRARPGDGRGADPRAEPVGQAVQLRGHRRKDLLLLLVRSGRRRDLGPAELYRGDVPGFLRDGGHRHQRAIRMRPQRGGRPGPGCRSAAPVPRPAAAWPPGGPRSQPRSRSVCRVRGRSTRAWRPAGGGPRAASLSGLRSAWPSWIPSSQL